MSVLASWCPSPLWISTTLGFVLVIGLQPVCSCRRNNDEVNLRERRRIAHDLGTYIVEHNPYAEMSNVLFAYHVHQPKNLLDYFPVVQFSLHESFVFGV